MKTAAIASAILGAPCFRQLPWRVHTEVVKRMGMTKQAKHRPTRKRGLWAPFLIPEKTSQANFTPASFIACCTRSGSKGCWRNLTPVS